MFLATRIRYARKDVQACFRPSDSEPTFITTDAEADVLLCHGHRGSLRDFARLSRSLHQVGLSTCGDTRPGRRTIEDECARVLAVLEGSSRPRHLVGHSLGGLILAQAARQCPEKVASLTLIASPVRGNAVCAYIPARMRTPLRALAPGGALVTSVEEFLASPSCDVLQVVSRYDPLVSPSRAHVQSSRSTTLLVDHGHLTSLADSEVCARVAEFVLARKTEALLASGELSGQR